MKKLLFTLLILLLPNVSFAAIAHYASYDASNNFSFSMDGGSGANRVIIFYGLGDTSDNISSVTWNGESFTKIMDQVFTASTRYAYIWYLIPAGTGTGTFTANGITGSSAMTVSVYTGAGTPTNVVYNQTSGTSGSISASPTPASDSWIVGGGGNLSANSVAGANTTFRSITSSQWQGDSNGVVSPTAFAFTWGGASTDWNAYAVELPKATATAIHPFWAFWDF